MSDESREIRLLERELAAAEAREKTLREALEKIASQPRETKARKMEIARAALAALNREPA